MFSCEFFPVQFLVIKTLDPDPYSGSFSRFNGVLTKIKLES
jgi:hypothetical protein